MLLTTLRPPLSALASRLLSTASKAECVIIGSGSPGAGMVSKIDFFFFSSSVAETGWCEGGGEGRL